MYGYIMKNIRFYLIFSVLGVIIILLSISVKSKTNVLTDLTGNGRTFLPVVAKEAPTLEIQNFKLIQTNGEKKQWELVAESALEYEEVTEIQIKNTTIKFFKDNKVVLTLQAQDGAVDLRTKDIKIAGKVDAISSDGLELKTDSLKWLAGEEKLATEDSIVLTKSGIRMEGKGLEADMEMGRLEIKKSTRVIVPRK
jgi:LPS export ABC transporter protein LptC